MTTRATSVEPETALALCEEIDRYREALAIIQVQPTDAYHAAWGALNTPRRDLHARQVLGLPVPEGGG